MKYNPVTKKGSIGWLWILLVLVILVGIGYLVWHTRSFIGFKVNNIETSPSVITWRTYTNTEKGFSFKYPAEAKITCTQGDFFNQKCDGRSDREVTIVLENQKIFSILAIGNESLTAEGILDLISAPATRKDYTITPVTIGGVPGFKIFNPNAFRPEYDYYKVDGSLDNFSVEILKGYESADKVYNFFKFN